MVMLITRRMHDDPDVEELCTYMAQDVHEDLRDVLNARMLENEPVGMGFAVEISTPLFNEGVLGEIPGIGREMEGERTRGATFAYRRKIREDARPFGTGKHGLVRRLKGSAARAYMKHLK